MWVYEVAADDVLLVLQLMIHKPGKPWTQRKAFRPISLCNDLYKVFDGCLYFYMARETGMIQEAVPGEELIRDPYIGESQRAYLRQRTTLDNLLCTGLVQLRAQACDFIDLISPRQVRYASRDTHVTLRGPVG